MTLEMERVRNGWFGSLGLGRMWGKDATTMELEKQKLITETEIDTFTETERWLQKQDYGIKLPKNKNRKMITETETRSMCYRKIENQMAFDFRNRNWLLLKIGHSLKLLW